MKQSVDPRFKTNAGIGINELYTPEDIAGFDNGADLGVPGGYPFTRGPYPGMYRERVWTRRFQVGFGSPQESNERINYLVENGANGFVITIDLPTSYGFDSDDPIAKGEVGVTGVAISTLEDMEALYSGFAPDSVSYALSIRPPVSSVTLAMLAVVAKRQNIDLKDVIGTQQNDPFYQMSGGPLQTIRQFFPMQGTLRLCLDNIEFISKNMPRLNWMVTNGYNLRETGIDAIQDGAFSLGHAFDIFRMAKERGMDVNLFPRKASFFLSASIDFFEEIAKFRAMRRLYARTMREHFGATNPECWRMRFSVQSAGNTLTTQQPQVNVVRAGMEAMAAALGGAQSIHLCSYDEGHGLPTEESSRMALRTQQVVAYETGITKTVDPLGGSYYVENLTNQIEAAIQSKIAEADARGGMAAAIQDGWLDEEINRSRLHNQSILDNGEKTLVGVNQFKISPEEETPIEIHKIRADEWGERRSEYLRNYRRERDAQKWAEAMAQIDSAWKSGENMVPVFMHALENKVTMGECHEAMRQAQKWSFRLGGERPDKIGQTKKSKRILLAKMGLDCHDTGIVTVQKMLLDAGYEVSYLGLHNTAEQVVGCAIEGDVDAIGVSFLSGQHMTQMKDLMTEIARQSFGTSVFCGGVIPADDAEKLQEMGVKEVIAPGTLTKDVVAQVERALSGRSVENIFDPGKCTELSSVS